MKGTVSMDLVWIFLSKNQNNTHMTSSQLIQGRQTYKPFLYEQAYQYWMQQQNSHWLAQEVSMTSDIQDWKLVLSESEKKIIGGVLKGFIQTELLVNDYWSRKVAAWFPHPEIAMMATTFGAWETIHAAGYAHLNDTLGIHDYDAFLYEPTAKAKLDHLVEIGNDANTTLEEKALSLAVFSAFTEGVSLFSSFAMLLNFSRFNKLKGVAQIISWSILDESLHSTAGCWLFRELINENPDLLTDDLKKKIYEAARVTVALEDDFIDMVFDETDGVEGLSKQDMKTFIRNRANTKLGDLGLKKNWKNIDQEALKRMEWFDFLASGQQHHDFFAGKSAGYAKGNVDFDSMWDGVDAESFLSEEQQLPMAAE